MGLADYLEERGHKVFGPRKESAILEGSKAFSKDFMKKHNIPTAKYEEVTDYESAVKALDAFDLPVVVKADGLAAGILCFFMKSLEKALEPSRIRFFLGAILCVLF